MSKDYEKKIMNVVKSSNECLKKQVFKRSEKMLDFIQHLDSSEDTKAKLKAYVDEMIYFDFLLINAMKNDEE